MIALVARRFGEFLDDRAGSGAVGVPHPKVDHVETGLARLVAHLVDYGKDVGRKLADAIKLLGVSQTHLAILSTRLGLMAVDVAWPAVLADRRKNQNVVIVVVVVIEIVEVRRLS